MVSKKGPHLQNVTDFSALTPPPLLSEADAKRFVGVPLGDKVF